MQRIPVAEILGKVVPLEVKSLSTTGFDISSSYETAARPPIMMGEAINAMQPRRPQLQLTLGNIVETSN